MSKDPAYNAKITLNPAKEFVILGLDLNPNDYNAFNDFFKKEVEPSIFDNTSFKCYACRIGCFAIAITLAAMTAVALLACTVDTPVVVLLSAYASVSAVAALAFVQGLDTIVILTATLVCSMICDWMHVC
jgi:hypothetical protein